MADAFNQIEEWAFWSDSVPVLIIANFPQEILEE
jgi:hypothetical protein